MGYNAPLCAFEHREMSAIVAGVFVLLFEIIIQGTPLEGAKLLMDRIALKGYCAQCDEAFDIRTLSLSADLRQHSDENDRRPGVVHRRDRGGVKKREKTGDRSQ